MSLGDAGKDLKRKDAEEVIKKINPRQAIALAIIFVAIMAFFVGFKISPEKIKYYKQTNTVYVCPNGAAVYDQEECIIADIKKPVESVSQTSIQTTTSLTSNTVSTTQQNLMEEKTCIEPPESDCYCKKWDCPDEPTTTTTCVRLPYLDYQPETKSFKFTLKDERLTPNSVEAFVNDTAVVIIENKQGLYKLWNSVLNESLTLKPEASHIFTFKAQNPGYFSLACTEFCKKKVTARINVVEPYKIEC